VHDQEGPQQKAIRLLNRQLGQLQTVRGYDDDHPEFTAWRDTTKEMLQRFLGKESQYTKTFNGTRFYGPSYLRSDYPGVRQPDAGHEKRIQAEAFQKGCATVDATIRAAIRHVEDLGVHVEEPKPAPAGRGRSGGVSQTFHAPVTMNQAIAADSAVQRVSHLGDNAAADLKEISNLLQQSQDLSPNQVRQGVAGIEALAVEVEKPEDQRNWKAMLDYGQRVLDLAGKAADLGAKMVPYTPTIVALVEKAKHYIK
jgi:hypothetical protein